MRSSSTTTTSSNSFVKDVYNGVARAICHNKAIATVIIWLTALDQVELDTLDYEHYLPLFLDGLCETQHPHEFLARKGAEDLITRAPDRVTPLLPAIIPPLRSKYGSVLMFRITKTTAFDIRATRRSSEHSKFSGHLLHVEDHPVNCYLFQRVRTGFLTLL